MTDLALNPTESMSEVIRAAVKAELLKLGIDPDQAQFGQIAAAFVQRNTYTWECWRKRLKAQKFRYLAWKETKKNLTTYEGLNDWLSKYLKGSSYTAAFYVGLIDATVAGTLGSNPVTTTNGQTTVSVAHTSHGLAIGDVVNYAGSIAINGVTLNGHYTVLGVTNANAYTVTAGQTANSGSAGGGSAMTFQYLSKNDTAAKINTTINWATTNGWEEGSQFSGSTRPALTLGSVSGQSVDNTASKASYTITGIMTVNGGFIATNSTVGSTSGVLLGEALFTTARGLLSTDILLVSVFATAASG